MLKNSPNASKTKLIFFICLLCTNYAAGYHCYRCQGSDCQKESKLTDTMECESPWDDCVSVFDDFHILARGCYSTLPQLYRSKCDEADPIKCHKCFDNLCNDKGPANCIHCNNEEDWNCFYDPVDIDSARCPISASDATYCFVRYNSSGYMERGCLTTRAEQKDCNKSRSCSMCLPVGGVACNIEFQPMLSLGSTMSRTYALLIAVAIIIITNLK